MNALHIVLCMLLTSVFVGLNTGQETEQEQCSGNQTSYMRLAHRMKTVPVSRITKKVITVPAEGCSFLEKIRSFFRTDKCDTRYRVEYEKITYNDVKVEPYYVNECCTGYIKVTNSCIAGCPKGIFGENCTKNCSCANQDLFCDRLSGDCLCPQGYTGDNCTDECEDGFFGRNCTYACMCQNNSTCNSATGECNCTSPGWEGDTCNTECTNGTYGLYCNEMCSCNENETCDHVTGNCTCKPGWGGDNCSLECEHFTFGIGCMKTCTCDQSHTEYCDKESGLCNCTPGYIGNNCSRECPFGVYGQDCKESCSVHCKGTSYCDPINGTCICINKKGVNCSEECEAGFYGLNCEKKCTCNTTGSNGSCTSHDQCLCLSGWTGPTCEEACPSGLYGPDCSSNCTDKCRGTAHCDRFNGTCTEGNKEARTQTEELESFIEENLLYIVIPVTSVLLLVVALVIAFCCRKITTQKRNKKNTEFLNASVQENPSYSSCSKETIPLEKSEQKVHMYEDAVLENETRQASNNVAHVNKAPGNMDSNHVIENGAHACAETNMTPDNIENDYSVPDKGTDTKEHINDGEHFKGGEPHQTEELYDSTQDNVIATETAPNEYNTFQDVIKLQQEATRKESDSEEDYDVITRTESHKTKPEDLEHYSSFEQVRKLTRQDSLDEEEPYNALNEHLSEHRSALVNDSQYHHISLKDKTIDGKTFTVGAPHDRCSTQRQISSGKKLSKQRSLQDSDAIHEEHEEEEMAAEINLTENKTKSKAGEMLEEDITEVIYDECDLDDMAEEHNSERSKLIPESVVESESNTTSITEIVYEECDEPGDEQSRPPSAVVYEDVDEEEDSKHDSEDEEAEVNQDPVQNKPRPHVKRTVDRRREDYEDFAL